MWVRAVGGAVRTAAVRQRERLRAEALPGASKSADSKLQLRSLLMHQDGFTINAVSETRVERFRSFRSKWGGCFGESPKSSRLFGA